LEPLRGHPLSVAERIRPLLVACLLAGPLACCSAQAVPPAAPEEPLPPPPSGLAGQDEESPEAPDETPAPEGEEDTGEGIQGEPGASPELAEDEFKVEADSVYYEAGAIYGRGHVRIHHKDLVISAEEAEIDDTQTWAQLRGNVLITSPDWRTTGKSIRVNLDTEEWELLDGETKLDPEFFEGSVREPVYVRGDRVAEYPQSDTIVAEEAGLTTCDRDDPHYDLRSDSIRIRLGRDITLDHPSVYVLGRRLFRYPGKLRFRITDDRSRLIPELGHNDIEGFYAKFAYPYEAGPSANGLLRLHLTSKRGIGAGAEHAFDTPKSAGEIGFFYEPEMGAYSATVRHRYQYTRSLSTNLNASLQTNSGYGLGSTTSFSSDLTIRNDTGDAHTTLGFQESQTSGSGYSSRRFTNNFTHQQRGPAEIDWTVRSTYRASAYGSDEPTDEELDVSLDMSRRQDAFDWDLSYRQRHDIDGDRYERDSQYFALDQLPAISLQSDTDRLGLKWGVPIRTRLELGHFRQQPDDLAISRASFDAEVYGETVRLAPEHELRSGAAFRQSWYSDGSAQYDLRLTNAFQSHWGGPWYSRLDWDFEQAEGFSPMRLDFAAKRHDVELDLSHYVANRSRIELGTGYDIETSTWRDLLMRAEFTPNLRNRFEVQTAYDIERSAFRPLEVRWQFVKQHKLDLGLTTSYDIERSELSRVTMDSDWVINRNWRLETLTGYSGPLGELDFLEARITRDLHCWIASLSYSLSQREIRLNVGLKALPFRDWEYGLGSGGQWLSTSSGQYY
jgi:hypothetical protein